MTTPQKVVFLDRDGVINEPPRTQRYVLNWKAFRFNRGAPEMLAALYAKGYRLVVVTNQQGVGKGLLDRVELQRIHDNMCAEIERYGARIDGVYFCPHLQADNCACRKPKPGLIFEALDALAYAVDLEGSWFIGDALSDVEAGQRAGLRTLLVGAPRDGKQTPSPTLHVRKISEIAELL